MKWRYWIVLASPLILIGLAIIYIGVSWRLESPCQIDVLSVADSPAGVRAKAVSRLCYSQEIDISLENNGIFFPHAVLHYIPSTKINTSWLDPEMKWLDATHLDIRLGEADYIDLKRDQIDNVKVIYHFGQNNVVKNSN